MPDGTATAHLLRPKLATTFEEGYGPGKLRKDVLAGLTVAVVALPLSMAIAVASGVSPERGLYTAIIGGALVSALGGSRYQIGGPAGAFVVLVAATVAQFGLSGLFCAVFLSGLVLTALGLARLGGLVRAGDATEADAGGILVGLVQGGFETTMSLISNAVFTLLTHPHELDRVRADERLLPSAIVEVLRYEGPFKYVMRQAYEDLELGGHRIEAGSHLMLLLGAANRDPAVFPRAHLFDIARDGQHHVAFGLGPHFCLGAPLARMQAELAIGTLIQRFEGLRLVQPASAYRWKRSALLRQLSTLPLQFEA